MIQCHAYQKHKPYSYLYTVYRTDINETVNSKIPKEPYIAYIMEIIIRWHFIVFQQIIEARHTAHSASPTLLSGSDVLPEAT